jgi:hypothetical protein
MKAIGDITPDEVRAWTLWMTDPFRDVERRPIVQVWRDRIRAMPVGDERAALFQDYHERVTEVLLRYYRAARQGPVAASGG